MLCCLFIHQAAELYGSDRVLLELVSTLKQRGSCLPIVVVPEDGPLVRELRSRGIEVHLAEVLKVRRDMFTLLGLWRLVLAIFVSVRQINRVVAGRQIDVVHSNTLAVLAGAVWAMLRRKPHIWHIHEIVSEPKIVANGFAWMLRLFADHVVAISRMTLENLTSRQAAIGDKASIIWNGLDAPPLVPEETSQSWRASLGFARADVVVGMLGRINQLKGHGLLLDAAKIVAQRRPGLSVRYLIVGNVYRGQEHYLEQFLAKRAQLGLDELVVHHDFVENVWPVWAAVDIGVVPSTEPEGFGMVAIEAMAIGKPVIGAAHGGILDIIVDRQTGLLVPACQAEPLAQAIIELAENPVLRRQLGESSRSRVALEFSMDSQARKFEQVYRDLLKHA